MKKPEMILRKKPYVFFCFGVCFIFFFILYDSPNISLSIILISCWLLAGIYGFLSRVYIYDDSITLKTPLRTKTALYIDVFEIKYYFAVNDPELLVFYDKNNDILLKLDTTYVEHSIPQKEFLRFLQKWMPAVKMNRECRGYFNDKD